MFLFLDALNGVVIGFGKGFVNKRFHRKEY